MLSKARTRNATGVAAAVLAVVGAVLVAVSVGGSPDGASSEPPRAATTSDAGRSSPTPPPDRARRDAVPTPERGRRAGPARDTGGVRDLVTGPVLGSSTPVRVAVPRLGITSPLVGLGLDAAGAMEVPQDPAVAGWYTLGPTPGALGPAVIAGHVTWDQAPAVFYRLGTLRRGDRVEVAREDGTTAVFGVTRVATFLKSGFPTRSVFGRTPYAGLRLITCGGDYDSENHRYLHNVVAYARLLRG